MGIKYKWNEQESDFVDIKPWMRPMHRCFPAMTIQYISCIFYTQEKNACSSCFLHDFLSGHVRLGLVMVSISS
jgi:hypothetical protein